MITGANGSGKRHCSGVWLQQYVHMPYRFCSADRTLGHNGVIGIPSRISHAQDYFDLNARKSVFGRNSVGIIDAAALLAKVGLPEDRNRPSYLFGRYETKLAFARIQQQLASSAR